jgi:hypothetical protein
MLKQSFPQKLFPSSRLQVFFSFSFAPNDFVVQAPLAQIEDN